MGTLLPVHLFLAQSPVILGSLTPLEGSGYLLHERGESGSFLLPAWLVAEVSRRPETRAALFAQAAGPGKRSAPKREADTVALPPALKTPSTRTLKMKLQTADAEAAATDLFTWFVTAKQPKKAAVTLDVSAVAANVDKAWFAALQEAVRKKFAETQIVRWEVRFDPPHPALQNFFFGHGKPLYRLRVPERLLFDPASSARLADILEKAPQKGTMHGITLLLREPAQDTGLLQTPLARTWPLVLSWVNAHADSLPLSTPDHPTVFWILLKNNDGQTIIRYGLVRKPHAVRVFVWDKHDRRWDILELSAEGKRYYALAMRQKNNREEAAVYLDATLAAATATTLWQTLLQEAVTIVARRRGLKKIAVLLPDLDGWAAAFPAMLEGWLTGGFLRLLDFEGILEIGLIDGQGRWLAGQVFKRRPDNKTMSPLPDWPAENKTQPPTLYLPGAGMAVLEKASTPPGGTDALDDLEI